MEFWKWGLFFIPFSSLIIIAQLHFNKRLDWTGVIHVVSVLMWVLNFAITAYVKCHV